MKLRYCLLLLLNGLLAATTTAQQHPKAEEVQQGVPTTTTVPDAELLVVNNKNDEEQQQQEQASSCASDGPAPAELSVNQTLPTAPHDDHQQNNNNKMTRNTISDGVVHELGLHNLHSVVSSSSFTIVLFVDGDELHKKSAPTDAHRKRDMLHRLAREFGSMKQPNAFFLRNLKIHFAMIDTRRHHELRRDFLRWTGAGEGQVYEKFYEFWSDLKETWSKVPDTMVNSTTFMALSQDELPTFPSEWAILHGGDFNIVNCIDESEGVDPLSYVEVREWMLQEMRDEMHFTTQGPGQPRLPFRESDDGPRAAIRTQISREQKKRNEYVASDPMTTIDWDVAKEMGDQRRKMMESENVTKFQPESFEVHKDEDGDAYFKYKMTSRIKGERDAEFMEYLSDLTDIYLAWADSYENLWDEERRAREDERTNYGTHLQTMTSQLRDTLFSAFEDLEILPEAFSIMTFDDIPVLLQDYFEDMLFGFGRSRKSLQAYLEKNVYPKTAEQAKDVALFERIREYMETREEVGRHEPYSLFFRSITIKFYAILAEFHNNLSRDYLKYFKTHPEEKSDRYNFAKMDRIDMKDPENFALLSDYEEFQRRYVSQRTPFILSNVDMTQPYNYTLDLLVEKCGFVDVTKKVRESMFLGDKSVKGWGGLKKFEIPRDIMTQRRNTAKDTWDEKMSLEQFVELAKHFDNIYLHDCGLKTKCTSLFWEQSPYDPPEKQFFRIPSVIGRYDLLQKLPYSDFQNSWPSLFIGRKGSNSKLHVDSGATGFWMFLVSGRKRWVVYDEAERPYLYERIEQASYMADVLALNATQDEKDRTMIHDYFDATYPLLNRASAEGRGYEIIQEPGDLVYIPPGSPHAVENLEDIVGISFNQVPLAGVTNHLFSMIHDKRNFAAVEIILRYIMSEPERGFSLIESNKNDPLFTTFGEYMAQ